MEIFKEYRFEAAHRLVGVPKSHPCSRLHGHSYRLSVHVTGRIDPAAGWIMDFADLDKAVEPLFEQLDHRYLNDVDGLRNPTCEVICRWLWA